MKTTTLILDFIFIFALIGILLSLPEYLTEFFFPLILIVGVVVISINLAFR